MGGRREGDEKEGDERRERGGRGKGDQLYSLPYSTYTVPVLSVKTVIASEYGPIPTDVLPATWITYEAFGSSGNSSYCVSLDAISTIVKLISSFSL